MIGLKPIKIILDLKSVPPYNGRLYTARDWKIVSDGVG